MQVSVRIGVLCMELGTLRCDLKVTLTSLPCVLLTFSPSAITVNVCHGDLLVYLEMTIV
jgi:hypothetical protein